MRNINEICDNAIEALQEYIARYYTDKDDLEDLIQELADNSTPTHPNDVEKLMSQINFLDSKNSSEREPRHYITQHIAHQLNKALNTWWLVA